MKDLLSDSQLDKLSDILIAVGQVFFASIVVPFLFKFDMIESDVLLSGVALTVGSWVASLLVVKGRKKQ